MLKRGDVVSARDNMVLKGVILRIEYRLSNSHMIGGTLSKIPYAEILFDDETIRIIRTSELINLFDRRAI